MRVVVPVPAFVKLPLPLTAGAKVTLSDRLKIKTPLSVTPLVLPIDPTVPPLPNCRVPALIVVGPV